MDQKKTGQEWFKEAMPPGYKACLIREEPHYLKTQARSPILEDFGRSNCAILSFKGSNNFVINLDKMNIDFYDKNDLL